MVAHDVGRRRGRSPLQLLMAVVLVLPLAACFPEDNVEFRVLDDVPYHPVDPADLVVDDWSDLEDLAGDAPAVPERVVDVHRATPAPPAGAPVMVWVPGGAWRHHNQNTLRAGLERYVQRGWVVVTVGYTRADAADPSRQWPVQGHEIDWVVRWVRANAEALGVSADKVVLGGGSAGAHLAAQVATGVFDGDANPALPAPAGGDPALSSFSSRPDALVLLAGVYDLSPTGAPYDSEGVPQLGIPPGWRQEALLGCDPSLPSCADRVADASVVHPGVRDADLGNFPPTFLAHAQYDNVVPFAPNTFWLGAQICNIDYPDPDGGTHRVVTWAEMLEDSTDHQVAALDWAMVDYFLHRQGLLDPVPAVTPDWVCNQP
jgi:acetyl esterase/lipase